MQVTKHVESITTTKISESDILASKPTCTEIIGASFAALKGRMPAQSLSLPLLFSRAASYQSLKVAVQRDTTVVAGTYKRLLNSQALGKQHVDSLLWASGLNMVKPRASEQQECEGKERFLHVALRTSPFPLVCLKV
jgi:hypothetical protein